MRREERAVVITRRKHASGTRMDLSLDAWHRVKSWVEKLICDGNARGTETGTSLEPADQAV